MSRSCRMELPVVIGNRWETTRTNCNTRDMKNCAEVAEVVDFVGGHGRNRTGVHGFAVRCVTTPPRGQLIEEGVGWPSLYSFESLTTIVSETLRFGPPCRTSARLPIAFI